MRLLHYSLRDLPRLASAPIHHLSRVPTTPPLLTPDPRSIPALYLLHCVGPHDPSPAHRVAFEAHAASITYTTATYACDAETARAVAAVLHCAPSDVAHLQVGRWEDDALALDVPALRTADAFPRPRLAQLGRHLDALARSPGAHVPALPIDPPLARHRAGSPPDYAAARGALAQYAYQLLLVAQQERFVSYVDLMALRHGVFHVDSCSQLGRDDLGLRDAWLQIVCDPLIVDDPHRDADRRLAILQDRDVHDTLLRRLPRPCLVATSREATLPITSAFAACAIRDVRRTADPATGVSVDLGRLHTWMQDVERALDEARSYDGQSPAQRLMLLAGLPEVAGFVAHRALRRYLTLLARETTLVIVGPRLDLPAPTEGQHTN